MLESIPLKDIFAGIIAALAVIITFVKLVHSHLTFDKQHSSEKKNRFLDLASQSNNQYPDSRVDQGLLRHALYDFCNHRKTCLMLAIICLNRPDPEIAVESLRNAGSLFAFDPKNKSILRRKGNKILDIAKSILVFIYYFTSIGTLWFLVFFRPEAITLDTRQEFLAYALLLGILLIATVHSFFELARAGKKNYSIRYLKRMLNV